jgi:hypothetical protein
MYAKLDSSDRLKRVLQALRDHPKLTTMDIIKLANVCAVNTAIHELRCNGFDISCTFLKRGVYQYELRG